MSRPIRPDPARWRQDVLRAAVLDLAGRGLPTVFTPTVSVGDPRGRWSRVADHGAGTGGTTGPRGHARAAPVVLDHALRCDLVAIMLGRALPDDVACPAPITWLARPAVWDEPDCERAWLAAADCAHRELGVPLTFVVVTRQGWRDPRTGEERTWRRLRARR
ncbi:hypothetical protein [Nocardioides perillae]|uniref:Uncharacterized protein n=1 Tax=Nocardioides perillae TaxID=1119534 RepID=A0A7Y9RYB5_9ACTN|nr:hypothetical protein [Nocardioides perillae]NYG56165.1 hypothetical protein [Nocardioides perillae]